jgi:F-type H+-transporting ATPase subunit a
MLGGETQKNMEHTNEMTQIQEKAAAHSDSFFQLHPHAPGIKPEVIFHIGEFPIANSTLMLFLTALVVLVFGIFVHKKYSQKGVPSSFQNLLEILYEKLEGLFVGLTGSEKQGNIVLPIVGSMLLFVGISNFMGHIPILSSITDEEGAHLFRGATTDFNTTFSLGLIAVIGIQFVGFKENGLGYLGHFFKFKEVYHGFKSGISDGFLSLITFFVGLLELVSEFIKIISLSLRLFGNLFAGEIIKTIALASFAYGIPAVWLGMEFLIAVVQALVFGSLITVYYTLVLKHDTKQH